MAKKMDMGDFGGNGGMLSMENAKVKIPVADMLPYSKHIFTMYDGIDREKMAASIRKYGVLDPAIVRPVTVNNVKKYEILAGHNRWQGCKDNGFEFCDCIVRENLTEDEAEAIMIETNRMQRGFNDLPISEQAKTAAFHYDQLFSSNHADDVAERDEIQQRLDDIEDILEADENGNEKKRVKMEVVGEMLGGLCKSRIERLLRIDKLIDDLKPFLDDGSVPLYAGVALSFLTDDDQEKLLPYLEICGGISQKQAEAMKSKSKVNFGRISDEDIRRILKIDALESGETKVAKPSKPITVKFQPETFTRYFSKDTKPAEIAETIEKALEMFFADNSLEQPDPTWDDLIKE